jgi:hypothetical protein
LTPTPSPSTVIPPDRETWDMICAYLAGEEFLGDEAFSEGYLAEALWDRLGWDRMDVRAAWFDAVERGRRLATEHVRKFRESRETRR